MGTAGTSFAPFNNRQQMALKNLTDQWTQQSGAARNARTAQSGNYWDNQVQQRQNQFNAGTPANTAQNQMYADALQRTDMSVPGNRTAMIQRGSSTIFPGQNNFQTTVAPQHQGSLATSFDPTGYGQYSSGSWNKPIASQGFAPNLQSGYNQNTVGKYLDDPETGVLAKLKKKNTLLSGALQSRGFAPTSYVRTPEQEAATRNLFDPTREGY
jgi:hypothetical protein